MPACPRTNSNVCTATHQGGRPWLTHDCLFFLSSSLSLSSDLSITRPLRLLPAQRRPLTKSQCLNGFASTADMAVSVPEITPVPCPSHWEMMEGPWQSKGRKNGQRAGEKWLTDSLQAAGNGEWLLPSAHYEVLNASMPVMRSSNYILNSAWNQN